VFVDEAHGSRRHQAVDRPSGGDASPDLGGGDIKTRDRHPLEAPLRPGWYRVLTGTLHDHHGAERTGVVEPAPSSHVRRGVGTQDQEELPVGGREGFEGVGGHRRTHPVDLDARRLHAVDVSDRGFDHPEPLVGRGDDGAALLPRVAGDDEQNAIERERVTRLDGNDNVPDVHRVECAAEHAEPFRRPRHRGSLRGDMCRSSSGHTVETSAPRTNPYAATVDVHVLVRVWLPDRPGALGLVASRIGSVGGDIVGIDVLETGNGVAIDEFAVMLADPELVPLLVREIGEVDGASVEEVREVAQFPDPRLDALASATRICEAGSSLALEHTLVEHVTTEFLAEWAALVQGDVLRACAGHPPPATQLVALAAGTSASPAVAEGMTGPEDLAVAGLPAHGCTLLVGRGDAPFRRRERAQLMALAGIADRMWSVLDQR